MLRGGLVLAALATVLPGVLSGVVPGVLPALVAAPAWSAADVPQPPAVTGRDVSFPQCGAALPGSAAIAVVGVNDGVATGTNPCLAAQLDWARAATLEAEVAPEAVQLYVNTANPGHAAAWWPSSDAARDGTPTPAADGTCTGGEDAACAYVYGYSLARDDLARVAQPASIRWWLDVETVNSWSADRPANLASVTGMADAFRAAGVRIGIYSTQRQFQAVVGAVPSGSRLAGLPSWLAGAVTPAGATARCDAAGLVPGSSVLLAQYVAQGVDGDVVCRPLASTADDAAAADGPPAPAHAH